MQFFNHYGWIHWDSTAGTWHTVTGYELAGPGQVPTANASPVFQALDQKGEAAAARLAAARAALAQESAQESARVSAAHAAAAQEWAAATAPQVGPGPAQQPGPAEEPAAGGESALAQGHAPAPVRAPSPPAAAPGGTAAPAYDTPPGPPPASGATWDTEHKRDEDRADTQHVLDNARWDTQHTLDNARWDTRHTLDNTRWDTQHTLDNARWDTQHTLDNARWDTFLALRHSREDAAAAVEATLLGAVHGGYLTIAQGSLDRAVQRATYVTTAAGAVATLYTGILGLRFTSGQPSLPTRSLIPALFIGAAVAFSTFYMAFLRGSTRRQELLPSGLGGNIAETRLLDFMEWSFGGVLARAWSLRLSVISLALGLALLPIGFVQLSTSATWALSLAAVALLVLWIISELYLAVAGPPKLVGKLLDKRDQRQARLARVPDPLPNRPTGDDSNTGLRPFGLPDPPQRYGREGLQDPPQPPAAAVGAPPLSPKGADTADPPEPPPTGKSAVPPAPPTVLEPGPRPSDPAAAAPMQIEVDLRTKED